MTQIISQNNWWGGWASYTAWTWIDISAQNEISIDTDVVQTVGNMVDNLTWADDDHYPTAKAVADAISGGWLWDVIWPASSTDWDIVLFDWTSGKLIKDSWALLSSKLDASAMSNNNYGWAWSWDSTHTPTKWVLYDKIHTMDVEIGNKAADNTVVKLSWNQTINWTKTFWTSPVVPSKTTDATNTGTAIATEAQVYTVADAVSTINWKISSDASSSNKLMDKNYIDNAINSISAYYITKNEQWDQWATYAELATATTFYSWWVQRTPTQNDYTIVLADENHDNATTRYSYQWSQWEYQYTVNETALTQSQLDALNSWITSGKVSTYDWYASTISWKQDALVSWTNIKTINSESVLGSWDISINEVPAGWTVWQVLTKTNDWMDWETPAATWVISSNHTYEDMVHLSQAEYDALVSPDPDTFYSTPDDEDAWGFTPENVGNTWDKLEKTNTWYQWVEWELVEITEWVIAMRWPCDEWFHIPTDSERLSLYNIWTSLGWGTEDWTNFWIALKMPFAGRRNIDASVYGQWTYAWYWASSPIVDFAWASSSLVFTPTIINELWQSNRYFWYPIRPFKNEAVVPTSSWTKLYWISIEDGGIFWSSTDWLISLSSDWADWITISDKNLWATQVRNDGDTLSEANCGKYYQWGNNYWFAWTWALTTSWTSVDASWYWPWNYYSSSTFITTSPRDSSNNTDLRWWVTWILNSKYVWWEKIAEVPIVWGTWQVLTKTNAGYLWKDENTKLFTLSSTSDLTNAQKIYDFALNWWVPVVKRWQHIYYMNRPPFTNMKYVDFTWHSSTRVAGITWWTLMESETFRISASWTPLIVNSISSPVVSRLMLSTSAPSWVDNNHITFNINWWVYVWTTRIAI